MADPWIENVQNWLNTTYSNVPGWGSPIRVDGETGWQTMFALTRALQHELGITQLADSFGPTTMQQLTTQYGTLSNTPRNTNIIAILTCGLYCKGYNAGNGVILDYWNPDLTIAINRLLANIGLPQTGTVSPKLYKAILNMDAYVVVGDGEEYIREVQQWMNASYINESWFSIIPTDGSYSRDVQTALVYAIQKELGVAGANGNFGPGTRAAVRNAGVITTTSTGPRLWVKLFQAALRFNRIHCSFTGELSNADAELVSSFQGFVRLPPSGYGDYQTWCSLLVSNGDPDRSGRAADCITTITPERAETLVANGRTIIGRYLTNAAGSSLDKNIKPGELRTIFDAGMYVFPIFQNYGIEAEYFSYQQGQADALEAIAAARSYRFKPGTIIYFAVDYDTYGHEIEQRIIPHFEGIRDAFIAANAEYLIGVYGTRLVCLRLDDENLAVSSFVSGMSTGYSGNLGYSLPKNWDFDQISTITIGNGPGAIEIDNVICSNRGLGLDPRLPVIGQNSLVPSEHYPFPEWNSLEWPGNFPGYEYFGGWPFNGIHTVIHTELPWIRSHIRLIQQYLNTWARDYGQTPRVPIAPGSIWLHTLPVLDVDGQYGTGTSEWVGKFQTYYGLYPDGLVGPQTWNKMKATPVDLPFLGDFQ